MIEGRYTLCTRVAVFEDADGTIWARELWRKDLDLHLDYIADFHLCCPVEPLPRDTRGLVPVPRLPRDRVMALRPDRGWGSVLRNLVPNFRTVRRAVQQSQIVHSGGAGWAFPLSFYILPLSYGRRFFWIMLIESSTWMKPARGRARLRQLLTHHVHASLLGRALRRADAQIFTSEGYRSFFGIGPERSLIAPAVWIDEEVILSDEAQAARLGALPDDAVRLIFPARLTREKGVETVLSGIAALSERLAGPGGQSAPRIEIDLMGEGPMRDDCARFAETHAGPVRVRVLDQIAYGPAFFEALRAYHGALLANRQQEQPRILYDVFSQGLPAISSDTGGVRQVVAAGEDTLLYPIDDADALADAILTFAQDGTLREAMSHRALTRVRGFSQRRMHEEREAFLLACMDRRGG